MFHSCTYAECFLHFESSHGFTIIDPYTLVVRNNWRKIETAMLIIVTNAYLRNQLIQSFIHFFCHTLAVRLTLTTKCSFYMCVMLFFLYTCMHSVCSNKIIRWSKGNLIIYDIWLEQLESFNNFEMLPELVKRSSIISLLHKHVPAICQISVCLHVRLCMWRIIRKLSNLRGKCTLTCLQPLASHSIQKLLQTASQNHSQYFIIQDNYNYFARLLGQIDTWFISYRYPILYDIHIMERFIGKFHERKFLLHPSKACDR